MLSEVMKESPVSDYLKPKRKVVTTNPAVKKAYRKGYLKKEQETFTREECEAMIEFAINQHNRNAGQISMVLGFIFMALFADGLFRVLGLIPPFMGLDVNIIQDVVDAIKEEVVKQL
ncbi:MAG: hypothetical protein CM15mL1_0210 [Libanvirus sp.]|nr:MAG: hypothetical protein CM15mL1_0210 [Libanvirus sp.]